MYSAGLGPWEEREIFKRRNGSCLKGKQYSGLSKGFIQPLPYSGVLVLGTYYSAQECILLGWVRGKNGKI